MKGWKTTYNIGTKDFTDKAAAIKYAKEWANESGSPITINVERRRGDIGARGRLFGYSVQDLKYGKDIVVQPPFKRNPRRRNVRRPLSGWPNQGEVDSAVNRRAQAMARTGRRYLRADSDRAADAVINGLYGRNAMLEGGMRQKIRDMLWNDYQSYDPGYRGYHLEGHQKRARARRRKIEARPNPRMAGEPDHAKLLAKALKPGNTIVTMARIQQQAHDWGFYDITSAVGRWMKEVGATQSEMERFWLKRPERHRYRNPNSVRVKGFTGTITRRPDGTVQVIGSGKRA